MQTKLALLMCLGCVLACVAACGRNETLVREWRPEDHVPPPADPSTMDDRAAVPEPSETDEPPEASQARAAAALFRMSCAPCHGVEGHGDGPSRPPMARVQDFSDPAWQATRSNEVLAQVIFQGRGMMPGFGSQIQPEGIAALVMHVRSLSSAPPAPSQ